MGNPVVLVERYGGRGELVLNRPERKNAVTLSVAIGLIAGINELAADPSVVAILLRGQGGTFCAGLDLKVESGDPDSPFQAGFPARWAEVHAALAACSTPIVGALERAAIAGGCSLALACDVLIAGESARFHVSEVGRGMAAPMNVAWLTAKFGEARAIELVVGGQPLTGRELYEKGIAAKVVPDELVLDEARAYADALARNNPAAMAQAKEVIRRMNGLSFPERLALAKAPVE